MDDDLSFIEPSEDEFDDFDWMDPARARELYEAAEYYRALEMHNYTEYTMHNYAERSNA